MLGAIPLSRPKPPQAGAEGPPLQGYSSQRQFSTKVSGPPLAAALTLAIRTYPPPRHAKFAQSKFKRADNVDHLQADHVNIDCRRNKTEMNCHFLKIFLLDPETPEKVKATFLSG